MNVIKLKIVSALKDLKKREKVLIKTRFKKKRHQYIQQGKEMEMEKEIQIEFDNIKVL